MEVSVFKTENELLVALADYFMDIAKRSIQQHQFFNVALAGGKSPEKLYKLLASVPYSRQIDWNYVYFFFGDERFVPDGNIQRNSLMAQRTLFDPLHIQPSHIFKVDTSLPPDIAAEKYVTSISTHFKTNVIRFDLILLGLGENAHTASLFPHTSVLHEKTASIKAIFINDLIRYRITMTAPLINQAKNIAFLVFGKEKAEAVKHVFYERPAIENYPAQLINPPDGEMKWFLDQAAASLLDLIKE